MVLQPSKLVLISLVLLYMVAIFKCGGSCMRDFQDKRSLNKHRSSCRIFHEFQALSLEKRKVHAKLAAKVGVLKTKLCEDSQAGTSDLVTTKTQGQNEHVAHNLTEPLPGASPHGRIESQVRLGLMPNIDEETAINVDMSGRPSRSRRLPQRYRDDLPEAPAPIANVNTVPRITRVILHVRDTIRTLANSFGLLREYPYRPSYDPDGDISLARLSNTEQDSPNPEEVAFYPSNVNPPPWPFPNMSIFRLMRWVYSGSMHKSVREVNRLVREVILAKDFKPAELENFQSQKASHIIDTAGCEEVGGFADNWKTADVVIGVPTRIPDATGMGQSYTIHGFHYRPLVETIKMVFSSPSASHFHLSPFKRFWINPISEKEMRVYDELYTSDSWIQAHKSLQKQPSESGCKLEKVIAALMFWSDATHLADFGTSKAWPVYLYFGNLSKYTRSQVNSHACHPVAFIPSLPDSFQDYLNTVCDISKSAKTTIQTHCRRELVHAVWRLLLDEDFMHAYHHGIVIKCFDGILRRVFPRLFTYSADYPEKVLLAAIRDMGGCPCPRCLTPLSLFDKIGSARDMHNRFTNLRVYLQYKIVAARDFIYRLGKPVNAQGVERLLKEHSLVPTLNAFGAKLSPLGVDIYQMFVVDFMHECELGTWKGLFSHLVRLLYTLPGDRVAELDRRFRLIPTFGQGVIRRFANNASDMKKLAARDFEDLLQCSVPVFEGLFPPPHDHIVRNLLFLFAQWHALAKLRMQTDATLELLSDITKRLGHQLRRFSSTTCKVFATVELPREKAARLRREKDRGSTGQSGPKPKVFNLKTYKFHAMGDYVRTIMQFGTTDSYSTQIGELAHRVIKAYYGLTNKNNVIKQLTQHERRRTFIHRAEESEVLSTNAEACHIVPVVSEAKERATSIYSGQHYHMSSSRNHPQDIYSMLRENENDPALNQFIPKLKDHILYRLLNLEFDDERIFSDEERQTIRILDNRIYAGKVLRVNYTTYDVRRDQDSINPRSHSNVMVMSCENNLDHYPYWHAQVLGIFHASVMHVGPRAKRRAPQRIEFLWVRWYGLDESHGRSTRLAGLPKIRYIDGDDAFGFLDPAMVIRGCHLIPAFEESRGSHSLRDGLSLARVSGESDDWNAYYVNIFVDRDMYMRYLGGGVGHCLQDVDTSDPALSTADMDEVTDSDEEDVDFEEGQEKNSQDDSADATLGSDGDSVCDTDDEDGDIDNIEDDMAGIDRDEAGEEGDDSERELDDDLEDMGTRFSW